MRAVWSGAISFGLLNIPVKLYGATMDRALSFKLVDKKDMSPISYMKVCKHDGEEVPNEDIAKAFEYKKGQYVIVEDEDFDRAESEKTDTIDLESFVDEEEIDTILFEKPYYAEPEKKAAKAYALLRDALAKSGKVGIGTFVMREREHPCMVRAEGKAIILNQLRFSTEIRDAKDLALPAKKAYTEKELRAALSLVSEQTEAFDPKDWKDTYTEKLTKVIERKAKGRKPLRKGPKPRMSEEDLSDVLAMLQRSLKKEKAVAR